MATQRGTDWNRHHGVGTTLLENWVEERAVSDKILEERKNMAKLSKFGHQDILVHDKNLREVGTTTKDAFGNAELHADVNKIAKGRRRQLLEAELMKRALEDMQEAPVDRSARDWRSINHSDFSTSIPLSRMGAEPPDEEKAANYDHPITFWSDHATKGCGTVICSTNFENADEAAIKDIYGIRFGKHAAFSTPIKEFKKGPVKDV
ncbi:hypothetical protein BJ741DRAFT_609012 [Chytriomyces cf. hyalinus JEL632]|nr:hypothetical protein BJ741DRAFT_609012 [Chytriomyces cf. hyalinus JEL632]